MPRLDEPMYGLDTSHFLRPRGTETATFRIDMDGVRDDSWMKEPAPVYLMEDGLTVCADSRSGSRPRIGLITDISAHLAGSSGTVEYTAEIALEARTWSNQDLPPVGSALTVATATGRALDLIGHELFGLVRSARETDQTFRERMIQIWRGRLYGDIPGTSPKGLGPPPVKQETLWTRLMSTEDDYNE